MKTFYARTVEEVQACVREHAANRRAFDEELPQRPQQQQRPPLPQEPPQDDRTHLPLRPAAGRSKSALSSARRDVLDVSALTGVIDYQPDECTFTARAGTPVAEIEEMLAKHGQYLPFEPPFVTRGATLGGTVASGLSGPGRFRYGGVRDFLLGVRFIDGEARALRGGGRVVKNAAGFYLQHLLLGSLGTLGVLTEVTFKVFPLPQTRTTLIADHETLDAAIDTLARLRRSTFELEAAEVVPPARVLLRLGGAATAIDARAANLLRWLQEPRPAGAGAAAATGAEVRRIADAAEERQCWQEARELSWAPASMPLVKVATTLSRLSELDRRLDEAAIRRYGAGGDVAWIAWPRALSQLDVLLTELKMPGLLVQAGGRVEAGRTDAGLVHAEAADATALPAEPLLGPRPDAAFLARVRQTLDPRGVFAPQHD